MTPAPGQVKDSGGTTDESDEPPVPEGHVRLTIDDQRVDAPQGELIIRACERIGVVVPRFCDHPLLDPAGACRQCLVEVEMNGRAMPKPQASCTMTVADGMVVQTQHTSTVADKAQQGVMELLLINHPLDCPICDKGGECPLQNQAMSSGRADSRFVEEKRTFAKPLPISDEVLLDRERCVLCQRCTRFSRQIAGDQFIELLERGVYQQIGTEETAFGEGEDFQSYFSGNTIQICPVGALTSTSYRFRSRPFDLVSSPGVSEHDSSGAAIRRDWRRGAVTRVLAGEDPDVNEEWIDDKTRFAFRYAQSAERITRPMVRGDNGELHDASWTDALEKAASLLLAARDGVSSKGSTPIGAPQTQSSIQHADRVRKSTPSTEDDGEQPAPKRGVGVLPGGRLTLEDAYAYAKFARLALRTNDVDMRARASSDEELDFLAAQVVGAGPDHVSFTALEQAPAVLCVALEPEEEAPAVFLRLRKAARTGTAVHHLASWSSPAVVKTGGRLLRTAPGDEPQALAHLPAEATDGLSEPGAVVLVGERAAAMPGLYTAVADLAGRTGASVAWVPRRAGERGAVDSGAVPTLLPGGRRVDDAAARAQLASSWGVADLPDAVGRDLAGILTAAADGRLAGLVVGGVELDDLPDPALARAALDAADVVVSLEQMASEVTARADVVLPVAPVVNKSGTFRNWEGRDRSFATTIDPSGGSAGRMGGTAAVTLPDCRVLDTLAVEMDVDLFTQTPQVAKAELTGIEGANRSTLRGDRPTPRASRPTPGGSDVPSLAPSGSNSTFSTGEGGDDRDGAGASVRLATWRQLLDGGALLVDEPELAGTARPARLRVAPDTAERLGLVEGEPAEVAGTRGSVHLPVELADLPENVVWMPSRVPGDSGGPVEGGNIPTGYVPVATLGLHHGGRVTVTGTAQNPARSAP